MRLEEESLPYLTGEDFSTSFPFTPLCDEEDKKLWTRIEWLTKYVRSKKVIHVGCVDHNIETIESKLKSDQWLHSSLCSTADRCLGIDISEEGISYIRDKLGYTDVEALDVLKCASQTIVGESWDSMIVAEVLEHFDDPVASLRKLHGLYSASVREIVITVPNALAQKNFRNALVGKESINTDHRYWFTPYTVCKVLVRAGFTIDHLRMTVRKKHSLLRRRRQVNYPLLRTGVSVVARF